jgi:hypothetical protein
MSGRRRKAGLGIAAACLLAVAPGCQNGNRRIARAEPVLGPPLEPGATLVEATPVAPSVTWVDRHPMFSKPRDIYGSTNGNGFVKAAAATLVGIPVGVAGEVKQIVVGKPVAQTY